MKHGCCKTRLYRIWGSMKNRCYRPATDSYPRYGGRGVRVCDEWRNSFVAFHDWALAHGYADHLTIDRKNSNGNYEPSNCKWSTNQEQMENRSSVRKFVFRGELLSMREIARRTGFCPVVIRTRLNISGVPNGAELPDFVLTPGRFHRVPKYIPQAA